MTCRTLLTLALLGAALCAPAHAGVLDSGDENSDPVFTGSDVTFAAASGDAFRIRTYSAVGRRWTLSLPRVGLENRVGSEVRLAGAGEDRVLVHRVGPADQFSGAMQDSLLLAPARTAAASLAGCSGAVGVAPGAFAGDAGRAVFAPRSCGTDGAQRVVVRRHDSGAETELPVDPTHRVSQVRVAGSFIAFTDYSPAGNSTTLRVFDGAGTETTAITESGTSLGEFALQDDGVVALCREGQIVEYPLGGGTRAVSDSECEGPLVAGDTGYLSVVGDRANESVLAAYSGGRSRILARLAGPAAEQGRAAIHGKRVAFRRRFCGGWEVVTAQIGDRTERAEARCAASLGRPRRARGGTELAVPVRCPDGCAGEVTVAGRRAVAVRLGRRGRTTVRLPLLRSERRRRVTVSLSLRQPPRFGAVRRVDRARG